MAGCGNAQFDQSDANFAEMEQHKAWLRELKADDRDTARLLVTECCGEGSFTTAEGKLTMSRCMRRKYDEGVRATRSWEQR
jgi:hypothetical protein